MASSMTQRAVYFSRKPCRKGRPTEEATSVRRPTLFSVDNLELLAIESSRARQISQQSNIVPDNSSLSRDFGAYFLSSEKKNDPTYAITSHTSPAPIAKRRLVVPAFPMLQSLRWNPYVETSSMEDLQSEEDLKLNLEEERRFNCRCENCSTKQCPSRASSSSTLKASALKNNIMTFTDRFTMTPTYNDMACGCTRTPLPSNKVSERSFTASDIAVKDTQASVDINHLYHPSKCPAPILKKSKNWLSSEYEEYLHRTGTCCEFDHPKSIHQEAERDCDVDDRHKPTKVSSIKSFFTRRKKVESDNPRRIIYNEGISDSIAVQYPITSLKVPSPSNLRKQVSKASVKSKRSSSTVRCCFEDDDEIPYSHKTDSKYHHNCKHSSSKAFIYDNEEVKNLIASPRVVRKTASKKPCKYFKIPSISLPKKVLTSERDIEAYIDRSFPKTKVPVPRSRKQCT